MIKKIKDWLWEFKHQKIHKNLLLFYKLTESERKFIQNVWIPKPKETVVVVKGSWLKAQEMHKPSFNWHESCKEEMTWFDEEGRYIKNYFPDALFECTFFTKKVENDKLYWFEDYFYDKKDCYPVLNNRQIKKYLKNK